MRIKNRMGCTILLLIILLSTVTGCSANKAANNESAASANRASVFLLYDKVQLNQDKTQIDAALGSSGEENTSSVKSFSYMDKNHEFGVEVLYDEQQQAISKTVIYPGHQDIAPFTAKEVNEAQADKIQKGMSYTEVKNALGGDGIEVSATEIPFENNKISNIYRWANQDGSCIQVVILTDGTVGNVLFFDA